MKCMMFFSLLLLLLSPVMLPGFVMGAIIGFLTQRMGDLRKDANA